MLGYLVRICGSFQDAEDICQDVMVTALTHWQQGRLPDNPLAWLITTARNRATDRFRQLDVHQRVHEALASGDIEAEDPDDKSLEDDLLRLIFTCCHPALAEEVRVPLTLKSVTGFGIEEVARAFLVQPKTMEQRLLRAKKKIQQAGIAYEVPSGRQLDIRLDSVMQTLYLLFNEGYAATSGDRLIRDDLCREAIRLCTLMQRLFPGRAELIALLSLMLLQDSRRNARTSGTGDIVLLEHQDRNKWDLHAIQQGKALLDKALFLRQPPGVYQLQASIAALHAEAKDPGDTDWTQIGMLYRKLLDLTYTEVLHLNYLVAIAMAGHVEQALSELGDIEGPLIDYFPFYCARADFHHKLGDLSSCIADYEHASTLTNNASEKRFVESRLRSLG